MNVQKIRITVVAVTIILLIDTIVEYGLNVITTCWRGASGDGNVNNILFSAATTAHTDPIITHMREIKSIVLKILVWKLILSSLNLSDIMITGRLLFT